MGTIDTSELSALDKRIEDALENDDADQAEQLLKQRAPLVEALRLEAARLDELARTERAASHVDLLARVEHLAEEELEELEHPEPRSPRYRMWSFKGMTMHFDPGTDFTTNFLGSFVDMVNFRYCYYRVDTDSGDILGFLCFTNNVAESRLTAHQEHLDYSRTATLSVRKLLGIIDEELKLGRRFVFGHMPRFTKKRNLT